MATAVKSVDITAGKVGEWNVPGPLGRAFNNVLAWMMCMAFQMQPRRSFGWQILKVGGVPFYVEVSFLLFIAFVVFMCIDSMAYTLPQAGMMAFIIFFSLLAHEGGHALVGRRLGLSGISVSLVMFGGLTRLPPTTHGRSLAVTLAGPAGSLFMIVLAAGLRYGIPGIQQTPSTDFFTFWLMVLNGFWLIFNILPIFPMDGGQALFHGLTFHFSERTAMKTVAIISMAGCLLGGYFALALKQVFVLIFMFMFFMQNMQTLRSMRQT